MAHPLSFKPFYPNHLTLSKRNSLHCMRFTMPEIGEIRFTGCAPRSLKPVRFATLDGFCVIRIKQKQIPGKCAVTLFQEQTACLQPASELHEFPGHKKDIPRRMYRTGLKCPGPAHHILHIPSG